MRLKNTNSPDAPPRVKRFWREIEKVKGNPECDECSGEPQPCTACRDEAIRSLSSAEAVC